MSIVSRLADKLTSMIEASGIDHNSICCNYKKDDKVHLELSDKKLLITIMKLGTAGIRIRVERYFLEQDCMPARKTFIFADLDDDSDDNSPFEHDGATFIFGDETKWDLSPIVNYTVELLLEKTQTQVTADELAKITSGY